MREDSLSKRREKYVVFQLISTSNKTNTNYRVYSLKKKTHFCLISGSYGCFVYGAFQMVPAALLVFTLIQKADPQREGEQTFTWVAPAATAGVGI